MSETTAVISELTSRVAQAEARAAELEVGNAKQIDDQVAHLRDQLAQAETRRETFSATNSELTARIAEAEALAARLQADLERERNENSKVTQLQAQLLKAKEEYDSLEAASAAHIHQISSTNSELSDRVNEQEVVIDRFRTEYAERSNKQFTQYNAKYEDIQESLASTNAVNAELTARISQADALTATLRRELDQTTARSDSLEEASEILRLILEKHQSPLLNDKGSIETVADPASPEIVTNSRLIFTLIETLTNQLRITLQEKLRVQSELRSALADCARLEISAQRPAICSLLKSILRCRWLSPIPVVTESSSLLPS